MQPLSPLNRRYVLWRPMLLAVLTIVCLWLMGWAAWASWRLACNHSFCLNFWYGLSPLLVALSYLCCGIIFWRRKSADLPLEYFWVVAGTFSSGLLSSIPVDLGQRIFYICLSLLAPLVLHFHLRLITPNLAATARLLLAILYTAGALFALPFLVQPYGSLQAWPAFNVLWTLVRLQLVAALLAIPIYFIWIYHLEESPAQARRTIRLLAVGAIAALGPFLLFSLLPDTLGAAVSIPYVYTFPALLLLPVFYLYLQASPFVNQRIALVIDRSAILYLVLLVLGTLGLVTATTIVQFMPQVSLVWLLLGVLLAVLLLLASLPLHRLIHWLLHGYERMLRRQISQLGSELALTLHPHRLEELLSERLAAVLDTEWVAFYLRGTDTDHDQYVRHGALSPAVADVLPPQIPSTTALVHTLGDALEPVDSERLIALNWSPQGVPDGADVLSRLPQTLWLPLISASVLQGFIVIASRSSGRPFRAGERAILMTLAFQAAAAAHNTQLMLAVQQKHQELSTAHHQLILVREQERRQIARDLHDGPVQQLLGISYQVHSLRQHLQQHAGFQEQQWGVTLCQEIRRELLDVSQQLRLLIGELHPSSLEALGLSASLEEYIQGLRGTRTADRPQIHIEIKGIVDDLPPAIAICLLRCAQEAVRNGLRHAEATQIRITLSKTTTKVEMVVKDDGQGFTVPERLSRLTQYKHFGLAGMAERVQACEGHFGISSQLGEGTCITIAIPLDAPGNTTGASLRCG